MPQIIDLTLTITPGVRGVDTEAAFTKAKDGWNASTWHLYSHSCTHMDAQVHFEAGPGTIDEISLASCFGPAWIVKISPCAPQQLLNVDDVANSGEKFPLPTAPNLHQGTQGKRALFLDRTATHDIQVELTGK